MSRRSGLDAASARAVAFGGLAGLWTALSTARIKLTVEHITDLEASAPARYRAMVPTQAYLGLRVSELLAPVSAMWTSSAAP
jgi:hypothetical protein